MTVPSRIAGDASVPSLDDLRTLTLKKFSKNACNFQLEFAQALLEGKKHVLLQAGCGMGKTLGFWIPLLAKPSGILIIVSPLTLLGDQHAADLCEVGIRAINVDADTIAETPQVFEDIEHGSYRVVISSPEQLMKEGGGFDRLFRKPHFTSRLIAVIIDEAHCVSLWGSFRKQYQELGRLRHLLPDQAHFAIVSATLPATVLPDVMTRLGVSKKDLHAIRLSNDRSNIALVVRKMKYPANSYMDLDFLVHDSSSDSPADVENLGGSQLRQHHEKFVIFFDKNDAIGAADYLRSRLPLDQRHQIIWFMSDMSREFKDDGVEALAAGKIWGICSTDSFGMGIDLKDIELVIQWKVTCDPCILWQRFGRAARDKSLQATALLFVESKDCDQVEEKKTRKRKAVEEGDKPQPQSKRPKKKERPPPMVLAEGGDAEDMFWKARVAAYHEPVGDKKMEKGTINPVLDDAINADVRGIGCRRRPFQVFFENDELCDGHTCDNAVEGVCPRCSPAIPRLCCDLCNPAEFEDRFVVTLEKRKSQPRRTTVKPYKSSDDDKMLRKRLNEWRWKMATEVFGEPFTEDFGCFTFMPDEVLDRICDTAHHDLIISTDTLAKETRWHLTKEYGQSVIDIISEVRPAITLQPEPQAAATVATTSGPKPWEQTCTSCGQPGHNKRAKRCPNHESYLANQVKNGTKTLPHLTSAVEVTFTMQRPVDSNPSDLLGEFSQMRLTRVKSCA